MVDVRFVKHIAAAVLGVSLVFGGVAAGVGSIVPEASAQEAQAAEQTYVDVDALNVRSLPSLSGTITTTLSYGTVVTLGGGPTTADGYVWYQVQQGGTTLGWSVNGFNTRSVPVGESTVPTTPTTPTTGGFLYGDPVMVNTDLLNVRSLPSITASVLTVYGYGTSATITGDVQVADNITWYPIDNYGWVSGEYLWLNACGCRDGAGTPTDDTVTLTVIADVLNVRSAPSLSGTIVGARYFQDSVTSYGETVDTAGNRWCAIDSANTQWVSGQYAKLRPDLTLPPL